MNNQNTLGIGFLDMLTGFFVAVILLMLIFSYTLEKSGDIAQGPKDYLFYQLRIDKNQMENIKLKFFVQPPGQRIWMEIESDTTKGDLILKNDLFLKLSGGNTSARRDFYAWGPVKELDTEGNVLGKNIYFNLYGVGTYEENANWKIRVLYFHNTELNDSTYKNKSGNDIVNIVNQPIKLNHFGNTRKRETPDSLSKNIVLGEYSDFILSSSKSD